METLQLNAQEEAIVYALLCKARIEAVAESNRHFDLEDYGEAGLWNARAETINEMLGRLEA